MRFRRPGVLPLAGTVVTLITVVSALHAEGQTQPSDVVSAVDSKLISAREAILSEKCTSFEVKQEVTVSFVLKKKSISVDHECVAIKPGESFGWVFKGVPAAYTVRIEFDQSAWGNPPVEHKGPFGTPPGPGDNLEGEFEWKNTAGSDPRLAAGTPVGGAPKGRKFGYKIKVYDDKGAHVKTKDPGVMVVEGP